MTGAEDIVIVFQKLVHVYDLPLVAKKLFQYQNQPIYP